MSHHRGRPSKPPRRDVNTLHRQKAKRNLTCEATSWQVYKLDFTNGDEYVGITSKSMMERLTQHERNPVNQRVKRNLTTPGVNYTATTISRHRSKDAALRRERREIQRLTQPINYTGLSPEQRAEVKSRVEPVRRVVKPQRIPPQSAKCYKCGKRKHRSDFYHDKTRVQGIASRCIACTRVARSAPRRYAATATSEAREYTCRHCKIKKPAFEYNRDASRSSGLESQCRICATIKHRFINKAVREGRTAADGYAEFRAAIAENDPNNAMLRPPPGKIRDHGRLRPKRP